MQGRSSAAARLFAPLDVGRLTLRNRLVVAPMTRVSATADGRATRGMAEYYAAFAEGGFGLVKKHAGKPVLANGPLHDPAHAVGLLARGEADLVSLGRGALTHADWPRRVAEGAPLEAFDRGLLSPLADLENADRYRASRAAG